MHPVRQAGHIGKISVALAIGSSGAGGCRVGIHGVELPASVDDHEGPRALRRQGQNAQGIVLDLGLGALAIGIVPVVTAKDRAAGMQRGIAQPPAEAASNGEGALPRPATVLCHGAKVEGFPAQQHTLATAAHV